MKKHLAFLFIFTITSSNLLAQNYERYKKLNDTIIYSTNLGFDKKVSIIVPIEWQKETKNKFPLIIVFDKQNKRSNNYILNSIDYLTSNEQIPSSIIISIESEQHYRYYETQYKISDSNGLALENEEFIFKELIPIIEKRYHASSFRLLIGHSRYGYFTTSLFISRTKELNGIISMSPFFEQKNIDLTDSINQLNKLKLKYKKYYIFGIGNDYPEDFRNMDFVSKNINNPLLFIKAYEFKEADHNATPGLLITTALYQIFEDWSNIQSKYISNKQKKLNTKSLLEKEIFSNYGVNINLSLGILNGKGWYLYNEKEYAKAIQAWEILLDTYPNFSEAYLYIIKAQIQLKQGYTETAQKFTKSIANSEFYSKKRKKELEIELKEITE